MCVILALAALGISIFADVIVRILYGQQFAASALLLQVLIWTQVLVATDAVLKQAMIANGREYAVVRSALAGLAVSTVDLDLIGRMEFATGRELLDTLGKMTVLELVELKNAIEEEWGVTAAAPVAVAAAGPARRRPAARRRSRPGRRRAARPGGRGFPAPRAPAGRRWPGRSARRVPGAGERGPRRHRGTIAGRGRRRAAS